MIPMYSVNWGLQLSLQGADPPLYIRTSKHFPSGLLFISQTKGNDSPQSHLSGQCGVI